MHARRTPIFCQSKNVSNNSACMTKSSFNIIILLNIIHNGIQIMIKLL